MIGLLLTALLAASPVEGRLELSGSTPLGLAMRGGLELAGHHTVLLGLTAVSANENSTTAWSVGLELTWRYVFRQRAALTLRPLIEAGLFAITGVGDPVFVRLGGTQSSHHSVGGSLGAGGELAIGEHFAIVGVIGARGSMREDRPSDGSQPREGQLGLYTLLALAVTL